MEQHTPRPRRFSFSRRPQQEEPVKPEQPVTTIGFPIDALPLPNDPWPQERRDSGVFSSWRNDFKSRGRSRRSQSVDPNTGEGFSTSQPPRRLVKKQGRNSSHRESSVSSDTSRLSHVPLFSNISTRIRSRRASLSIETSNENTNAFPKVQPISGPLTASPFPTPRLSTTLPPGFNATITKDLMQAPSPMLTAGQDPTRFTRSRKESSPAHEPAIAQQWNVNNKRQSLRRAGVPFYRSSAEAGSLSQSKNVISALDPEKLKARETESQPDRKEIIMPESLRVGRSKPIEPGPKSPKRALARKENKLPQYSLTRASLSPPQLQERDCHHQENGCEAQGTSSSALSATGHGKTCSPVSAECLEPLSFEHPTNKIELTKKNEEIRDAASSPKPSRSPRPLSQPNVSISIESAIHQPSKFGTSSPAVSSPSTAPSLYLPGTPCEENASSSTEISSWSGTDSPRSVEATCIPRNTTSPRRDKYLAKIFVICCRCNYWHDIPSGMYAKMILPGGFLSSTPGDSTEKCSFSQALESLSLNEQRRQSASEQSPTIKASQATVQCCWCSHGMAKSCCTSWTTMVHLLERHH